MEAFGAAPKYEVLTHFRARPERVKQRIVEERGFTDIHLRGEDVAEFDYQPRACEGTYRIVVVRKDLEVLAGNKLLYERYDYFFYITNDRKRSANQVVLDANQRCAQEKLIGELKSGVHALRSPLDGLVSNWGVHGDVVARMEHEGLAGADAPRTRPLEREVPRREGEGPEDGAFGASSTNSCSSPRRSSRAVVASSFACSGGTECSTSSCAPSSSSRCRCDVTPVVEAGYGCPGSCGPERDEERVLNDRQPEERRRAPRRLGGGGLRPPRRLLRIASRDASALGIRLFED